jgi:hypothetical protein
MMMDAREERIRAKAHQLWEADGKPQGHDREHWEQAAKLVEEEEQKAAKAEVDPEAAQRDGSSPTNDPIGVTLGALKRQS